MHATYIAKFRGTTDLVNTLSEAYQQGEKWAASDRPGRVIVGYLRWVDDHPVRVPLWRRYGKTLRRVHANPLPAEADLPTTVGGA